jgi:serine/threonine-protein kinase HipA
MAVSLYGPELPLENRIFRPAPHVGMPSTIKDGAPDAWGMRVLLNQEASARGASADVSVLSDEYYLLNSGSDRIGGIDFQASPEVYVPRIDHASLDDLLHAADIVERGDELPSALARALVHGTSIGGARPKSLVNDTNGSWVAKFSSSTDVLNVVGGEAASIYLAQRAGIDVPESHMVSVMGRDVLLMRRFDRQGKTRKMMVTGVTIIGRGTGVFSQYGTYPELVAVLHRHGADAGQAMFTRIVFNAAISNFDDHMRNHSAFWDGHALALTPAYDLSPSLRSGESGAFVTPFDADGTREPNFSSIVARCGPFGITKKRAVECVEQVRAAINDHWRDAADHGRLTRADRAFMWGRQFLNPATLYGYSPPAT